MSIYKKKTEQLFWSQDHSSACTENRHQGRRSVQKHHFAGKNDENGWAELTPPGHGLKMQPSPACVMLITPWQSVWRELARRRQFHQKSPYLQPRDQRAIGSPKRTHLLSSWRCVPAGTAESHCTWHKVHVQQSWPSSVAKGPGKVRPPGGSSVQSACLTSDFSQSQK